MTVQTTDNIEYIIAFTEGQVWASRIDQDRMRRIGTSGEGLVGPCIETTVANSYIDGRTKLYAVDGTGAIIVDVVTNSVQSYTSAVTSSGEGELPSQCALISVYRGRIVLARQPTNARIWYLSRLGNPLDWDFNADPANTAAIAGVNTDVAQPGDSIMALMPYGDDYLIFGCASSLWAMIGDPAFGGQIQAVDRQTGVVGARAFTYDESGQLWFMSNSGLMVLPGPTARPKNLSADRLIAEMDRIDAENNLIQLSYDAFKQEVHIYITPYVSESPGTHWVYERRADAFWPDQYPIQSGPWSSERLSGPTDQRRRSIIGGNDGFIRLLDDDVNTDDGSIIDSFIEMRPIEAQNGLMESMAVEINGYLYESSGECTWHWFSADSPDEVRQLDFGTENDSGTWGGPVTT